MRSLDWELLPYFLAVARTGSLRAAARSMHKSYGSVNRNIQALETSYGVRLFHRSTRGFTLTEFGDALRPVVEDAERNIQAARRRVEGLDKSETGTIRFSLSPTLAYEIIAPIIGRFHAKYPHIDIEMRLTADIESIPNDETDVSLRVAENVSDDVVAQKLFRLPLRVYASKNYIAHEFSKAGDGGMGLNWLGFSGRFETENWRENSPFPNATMRHKLTDGYMRACLLNQDCGMSHLPTFFESVFPNLQPVPGTQLTAGPWVWILLHSDLRKTVRVRRFVDHLAQELREMRPKSLSS